MPLFTTNSRSSAVRIRHCPGGKSPSQKFPMRTRINRNVGWPMAAVMRRTWRFLPSTSSSPIQQSGTLLRKRMGGSRGGITVGRASSRAGSSVAVAPPSLRRAEDCPPYLGLRLQNPRAARQGFPALDETPRSNFFKASGAGIFSTCAQYSRSWAWRGCSRRSFHSGSSLKSSSPSESASSRPIG